MAEDRTWPENSWSFSIQKALDSGEGQLIEMEMLDACMITFSSKVLDEDGKWEDLDDLDENDKPPPMKSPARQHLHGEFL